MKTAEPEHRDVEKSNDPQEKSLLEKLSRFADYTTPAMKELLSYGEGKRPVAPPGSPI